MALPAMIFLCSPFGKSPMRASRSSTSPAPGLRRSGRWWRCTVRAGGASFARLTIPTRSPVRWSRLCEPHRLSAGRVLSGDGPGPILLSLSDLWERDGRGLSYGLGGKCPGTSLLLHVTPSTSSADRPAACRCTYLFQQASWTVLLLVEASTMRTFPIRFVGKISHLLGGKDRGSVVPVLRYLYRSSVVQHRNCGSGIVVRLLPVDKSVGFARIGII